MPNSTLQYSGIQLERIYAEMPSLREVVFRQPACTPEFFRAHFQEAVDRAQKHSAGMLLNIVGNPNTPLELVQRVVFYQKQLPFEPPYQAGLILRLRKSDMPDDPRAILQTYEHEAEGKLFVLTLLGLNSRIPDAGGKNRIPDQVNSYVPAVPPDFDLAQLGADEVVFLPGLYNEYSAAETGQLNLAEAVAIAHNRRVFLQKFAKHPAP
jgi:hypothetical protein